MSTIRQIFEDMPSILAIPATMQHRRVEVILLPLDEIEAKVQPTVCDEFGWPVGLFEKVTNGWQGEPLVRAEQDVISERLELK